LLDQKEAKNQGEMPNPFFLHTGLRNAARKNVFHTISPKAAALLPKYVLVEEVL